MADYPIGPVDKDVLTSKVSVIERNLTALSENLEGRRPKVIADSFKSVRDIISAYMSGLDNNSSEEALIGTLSLFNLLVERVIREIRKFGLSTEKTRDYELVLLEAANDLNAYTRSHSGEESEGSPAIAIERTALQSRQLREQERVAQLQVKFEEMERSLLTMEARFNAINETANKAIIRVEELTVQQADAMRTALTREVSEITDSFSSTHESLKSRLGEFDVYKLQAEEKISQLGLAALVGGHAKSAIEEQKAANWYRKISLALMAAAVGNVVWLLHDASVQTLAIESTIYRAVLSLLLIVPTAYAAKESAKHRGQAIELRRLSLDFAALEPFLKGMQGDEAQKTRAELARRAFFNGIAPDVTSSYGLDPQEIIMKGMDTIADLAKRKSS